MYNRYIPQPDGSYQRNRMQEPKREPEHPPQPPVVPSAVPECQQTSEPCPGCPNRRPPRHPAGTHPRREPQSWDTASFLKQLIPQNFNTEDLLVVLLLLLMAGDCREDHNYAMLTLVLYLFL